MPHFYFHLSTGDDYERDEVGSDLKDANEAYLEAFETAQQLVVDLVREHRRPARYRFDICDEQGRVLFQVPFSEIVGATPAFGEVTEAAARGHRVASEVRDQIISARAELQNLYGALRKLG